MPDKMAASTEKAWKCARDNLLISIPQTSDEGAALIVEDKGLGKARPEGAALSHCHASPRLPYAYLRCRRNR
jgi:hypothetical protein